MIAFENEKKASSVKHNCSRKSKLPDRDRSTLHRIVKMSVERCTRGHSKKEVVAWKPLLSQINVYPIWNGPLSKGKEWFSLTNRRFSNFWQLAECMFGNSQNTRFIQTAFSLLWNMAGVLWWSGGLFLGHPESQWFPFMGELTAETIYSFWVSKFTLWLKHCFEREKPFFKIIMLQSIQLELLKNGMRNIVMKLSILYSQHNL